MRSFGQEQELLHLAVGAAIEEGAGGLVREAGAGAKTGACEQLGRPHRADLAA